MNHSGFTIVTASLNSGAALERCLDSVAGQRVSVEHVLVDGGSTDGTRAIVERRRFHLGRVIEGPDAGIYDALNKGISSAAGAIIGILHADDCYADTEVLRDVLEAFADPAVDAVYGDLDFVDAAVPSCVVRRWRAGKYAPRSLYHGWMPPHPTFFVRRECYERFGLYRLDLGTAADYELMLRFLLVHVIRVKYIPRVLVKMRVGGASNASLKARLAANRMDRKAWAVNGLRPYPWTLLAKPLRKVPQWRLW